MSLHDLPSWTTSAFQIEPETDLPKIMSLRMILWHQITSVINNQNKLYRSHSTALLRCYINTAQLNRILAFYRWTIFTVKDAHAEYDVASVATFNLAWINSVIDEYLMKDPNATPQNTVLSVEIPRFSGANWHQVKSKVLAALASRTGNAGISLSYIVRKDRKLWEDTETMTDLHARRIVTKAHEGNTFDLDNKEVFRILLNVFASTTLDNLVKGFQAKGNGLGAWTAILANVEGASYVAELKRQGDREIDGAFFDPTKNFTMEQYFDKHVKSHELHKEANAPIAEWRKIEDFMKGVRCRELQNDFRGFKDDPHYNTFTTMYNKLNENYRHLVDQGILKPVSLFKRKISQIDIDVNTTDGGRRFGGRFKQGGRGRGRGRGRGHGRGRGRGRGRQGRSGGRSTNMANVNMKCLPSNLDLTNLSFSDEEWYGFTDDQRNAISALRRFRGSGAPRGGRGNDNFTSAANIAQGDRHIYRMVQLPPTPSDNAPIPPPPRPSTIPAINSNGTSGVSVMSSQAGDAFGRRS